MYHVIFTEQVQTQYDVALLIKTTALSSKSMYDNYIKPTEIDPVHFIGFSLEYNTAKPKAAEVKDYLERLLAAVDKLGVKYLLVNDSLYFKALAKTKKAEHQHGIFYPCAIDGYEHIKVILGVNYQSFIYDPKQADKLDLSLNAIKQTLGGLYIPLGSDVIHSKTFCYDYASAYFELQKYFNEPELTIDIEAYSLNVTKAGIGTITFCKSKHEGIAFQVDESKHSYAIRMMLRDFFADYKGKKIFHNASYDVSVLVYELFMENHADYDGMIKGIETLVSNIEDTKLIAYLATNSTARNELSLKVLAQPFLGNYAESEINDITKIPPDDLLLYNLKDGLGTFYVYETYYPIMVQDNQLSIYETIFKPSLSVIIQMQLTGVPLDMNKCLEAQKQLQADIKQATVTLLSNPFVEQTLLILRQQESDKMHSTWKTKTAPLEYFDYVKYNPASDAQNRVLLYQVMDLPVVKRTDKGMPSTSNKALKKLKPQITDPVKLEVIDSLMAIADASIILDNFINAFLTMSVEYEGVHWLHGYFNLGGTVSGRLSSNTPNMQNLPSSGTKYAKLIKSCIKPPKGWLLVGADFSSLEDRISALTTKDENKLKVYTDGFDGHCLRAYYYFKDQMPDIDPASVDSINSIAQKYKSLRQASKIPTFALTYGGTHFAITEQAGIPEDEAKLIEQRYHEMYVQSDQWVQDKINKAVIEGYVTCAFGLRVRTPLLAKTVMNIKATPYEAQKEARTAGNALGQSYGMLNNRAAIELKQRLLNSPFAVDILPIMHIHDAQYFLVKEDIEPVHWLNINLVECMEWQDLPEIHHPEVKLGGEMSIFYPDWSAELVIPNQASKETIIQMCKDFYNDSKS